VAHEDDMEVTESQGFGVDEVGMVHGRYGVEEGILDVEPPKPTPRWLRKLRAIVGKREQSPARPQ
jgi:hypothetical protein